MVGDRFLASSLRVSASFKGRNPSGIGFLTWRLSFGRPLTIVKNALSG
jgi:hypothetical protein